MKFKHFFQAKFMFKPQYGSFIAINVDIDDIVFHRITHMQYTKNNFTNFLHSQSGMEVNKPSEVSWDVDHHHKQKKSSTSTDNVKIICIAPYNPHNTLNFPLERQMRRFILKHSYRTLVNSYL